VRCLVTRLLQLRTGDPLKSAVWLCSRSLLVVEQRDGKVVVKDKRRRACRATDPAKPAGRIGSWRRAGELRGGEMLRAAGLHGHIVMLRQ